jgi:5-hydroxyisourate hydrolase-like protein (transthyretin family)
MKTAKSILFLFFLSLFFVFQVLGATITSLSTDKSSYTPGSVVVISGTVTPPGTGVAIQVKSPSGSTAWIDSVTSDSSGSFSLSFTLRSDAELGTYTVYATVPPGVTKTTTFTVSTGPPLPPPPPPPTLKKSSITIYSSSSNVTVNENVTIFGSLNPSLTNEKITISIVSPSGSYTVEAKTKEGNYSYTLNLTLPGTWYFRASWSGNSEYYSCQSQTISVLAITKSKLSLTIAPKLAGVNDTVIIYLTSAPLLSNKNVDLLYSYNSSGWQLLTSAKTNQNGSATFIVFLSNVGNYSFMVQWKGDELSYPSTSNVVSLTVIRKLSAEEFLRAFEQISNLTLALSKSELKIMNLTTNLSLLQNQTNALRLNLTIVQEQLKNESAKVNDLQSKLLTYSAGSFVFGLIVGALAIYILIKFFLK